MPICCREAHARANKSPVGVATISEDWSISSLSLSQLSLSLQPSENQVLLRVVTTPVMIGSSTRVNLVLESMHEGRGLLLAY
jgi:hypothetical protein